VCSPRNTSSTLRLGLKEAHLLDTNPRRSEPRTFRATSGVAIEGISSHTSLAGRSRGWPYLECAFSDPQTPRLPTASPGAPNGKSTASTTRYPGKLKITLAASRREPIRSNKLVVLPRWMHRHTPYQRRATSPCITDSPRSTVKCLLRKTERSSKSSGSMICVARVLPYRKSALGCAQDL